MNKFVKNAADATEAIALITIQAFLILLPALLVVGLAKIIF